MSSHIRKIQPRLNLTESTGTTHSATSGDSTERKTGLHPRNKHKSRYNFDQLITASPALGKFVSLNAYHDASIDFANPRAVRALNQALLKYFYTISGWDIPPQYLCPPIPGRADYIHYLADLLASSNVSAPTQNRRVRVLDIGVGANAIYPLIGNREYGWHFVGSDIDAGAIANTQKIIGCNIDLASSIELRLQKSASAIFKGIVRKSEFFDLTMCNPPFHKSLAEAQAATQRKWHGLGKNTGKAPVKRNPRTESPILNFGGQAHELYCAGGELAFIERMINESPQFSNQCGWFSTLVSKAGSLPNVYRALKDVNAAQVRTMNMAQGQKKSRLVAWTFRRISGKKIKVANAELKDKLQYG